MPAEESIYHIPALLNETIESLAVKPSGVYADATFGGGGHSRALLAQLGPEGRLFGFDRDLDALQNTIPDPRFTFVHSDFRFMPNFLRFYGAQKIDGIVADLGVSSHHFDDAARGFSFRADAPLDMRMNRSGALTAAQVVNKYSEADLARVLNLYGEVKRPMPVVRALMARRSEGGILTTGQLVEALKPFIDPRQEKKDLARIFQALRIEVNGELDSLSHLLEALPKVLRPGGRAAIITYHSLEDRLVKNYFRSGNFAGTIEKDFFGRVQCDWTPVGRQPVTPSAEEVASNPRARSAKLRTAEFTPNS